MPDVAYNGGVFGGVIVAWYVPFDPGNSGPGSFWIFGGTSAGAPQWAGITALIAQACGHRVGLLNDDLYSKGAYSWYFRDITKGNNIVPGIGGYTTTKGWDAVTGLGTPLAAHVVYSLSGITELSGSLGSGGPGAGGSAGAGRQHERRGSAERSEGHAEHRRVTGSCFSRKPVVIAQDAAAASGLWNMADSWLSKAWPASAWMWTSASARLANAASTARACSIGM